MTYHPDSFKQDAPASYYCSECKYRHNKGSIRYHDHWVWRTETPEVLKGRKHIQQSGISMFDIMVALFIFAIGTGLVASTQRKDPEKAPASEAAKTADYTPVGMYVWHDDQREVTCYVYTGRGISCVADTKKMLWLAQNPKGVPPQ